MGQLFVTIEHLNSYPGARGRGLCHRGARQLCGRYGLDWSAILAAGGVAAEVLEATGDGMALALVEHARNLEAAKNGR